MSHIAIESGAFVVSAPQYIPRSAFPDDFPVQLPDDGQALGRGGAAIFEPLQGPRLPALSTIRKGLSSQTSTLVAPWPRSDGSTSWDITVVKTSSTRRPQPITLRTAQHLAASSTSP